jgi:hypothetical protein
MRTNMLEKIGIILSYTGLFFIATYFGKAVNYFDVLFFLIGLLLGMALLEADENLLYKYYNSTKKQLATRSLLFIAALYPLGLFILTSTGSAVGVGMFLSIISGLALEFYLLRHNLASFQERFLYQLKRTITPQEHRYLTTFFISSTLFYGFLVIFLGR